jgi:hypothetical protein
MALQVGSVSLSRIMQNLALRYTSGINRKYRRTGHLFQGRYKAILLDADSYLLELVRYIHLNPVRARLVKQPDEYRMNFISIFCKLWRSSVGRWQVKCTVSPFAKGG